MAAQDKATVKGYFETGDKPTQTQFETLIDSYQDADAFLDSLASAKSGAGLIRVAASVASVVSAGSVGLLMLAADTTAAAQDVVGISSAMSVVVEAETLASARTEMGVVGLTDTQTVTNKTIDGDDNTFVDIPVTALAAGVDGELITWGADGEPTTVSAGTSGHVLTSNGAGAAPTFQAAGGGLPTNYITGLTLSNNSTDGDHDIDIAVGTARDSSDNSDIALSSAFTKRIDAVFATGTGNGGLATDLTAVANSTWYHVFVVTVSGSTDVIFDTSVTCANGVASDGVTAYRRIGSVKTDGSANILAFSQVGEHFLWDDAPQSVAETAQTYTTRAAKTMAVPPDVNVLVNVNKAYCSQGVNITSLLTADAGASQSYTPAVPQDTQEQDSGNKHVMSNTSSQIGVQTDGTSSSIYIFTLGWQDFRGKDG